MIDPFEFVLGILGTVQSFTLMVARAFRYLVVHFRFRESLLEMDRLGVGSIPIVFWPTSLPVSTWRSSSAW